MGGMGNNMFQIATAVAYSLRHNMPYCISQKIIHPHYPANNNNTYNFPNVKYCDAELNLPIYIEPHYHYSEIPYMPDVCLQGYFQSYKYFNDYKDEIIKLFGFNDIEAKEKVCAVHVRRTDYLIWADHHPPVTPVYLFKAIVFMIDSGYRKFKMFSDDIEWCKRVGGSFDFKDVETEYSEGNDELTDLREMASCASIVTANSSFSWFGAYFNPNPEKIVIHPRAWFGEALNHKTDDLYLPNAIII